MSDIQINVQDMIDKFSKRIADEVAAGVLAELKNEALQREITELRDSNPEPPG